MPDNWIDPGEVARKQLAEQRVARSLTRVDLEVIEVDSERNLLAMTAHFADGHKIQMSVQVRDGDKTAELFPRLWQNLKLVASEQGYFPWKHIAQREVAE